MTNIKQPKLPVALSAYQVAAQLNVYSADQMHAHYAKGREDEREFRTSIERILNDYDSGEIEDGNRFIAEVRLAIKQSLAQPAQEQEKKYTISDMERYGKDYADARDARRAQQPAQAAVPEGWQLVPKEITTKMQREGVCNPSQWRSLLLNAPAQPEPERGERAELLARAERAEGLIERIKDFAEEHNLFGLENEFSGAWGTLQKVCPADLSKLTIRSEK